MQKIIHEAEDQTIVTVRPKSYTRSSGGVWASDQLKIKWELPQLFEQSTSPPSIKFALPLRKFSPYFTQYNFQEND